MTYQVLETVNRAIESGIPFNAPEGTLDTPDTRAFLRKAAANAVVLLKNEGDLLPIRSDVRSIAVIGAMARHEEDRVWTDPAGIPRS